MWHINHFTIFSILIYFTNKIDLQYIYIACIRVIKLNLIELQKNNIKNNSQIKKLNKDQEKAKEVQKH